MKIIKIAAWPPSIFMADVFSAKATVETRDGALVSILCTWDKTASYRVSDRYFAGCRTGIWLDTYVSGYRHPMLISRLTFRCCPARNRGMKGPADPSWRDWDLDRFLLPTRKSGGS